MARAWKSCQMVKQRDSSHSPCRGQFPQLTLEGGSLSGRGARTWPSAHGWLESCLSLPCLRQPSPWSHTPCNGKAERQFQTESRGPRGLSMARIYISLSEAFGKHDVSNSPKVRVIQHPQEHSVRVFPLQDPLFSSQQLMCTVHTSWWRTGRWVSITCFLKSWEGSHMQGGICCRLSPPVANSVALRHYRAVPSHVPGTEAVKPPSFHFRTYSPFHKSKALTHWEYLRCHSRLFLRSL